MYEKKKKLEPKNKMLMIRVQGKVKLSFNQRFLGDGIFKFSREYAIYVLRHNCISSWVNTPSRFMLRKLEIRAHLMATGLKRRLHQKRY